MRWGELHDAAGVSGWVLLSEWDDVCDGVCVPCGDVWGGDARRGGGRVCGVFGRALLWVDRADDAQRELQCGVLLRWRGGGGGACGWGDGGDLSSWELLSDWEWVAGGMSCWDVPGCCWGHCGCGLRAVRGWGVLQWDGAGDSQWGVSCWVLVCGRDWGAERAVSARVLVSCRGGGAAGLCERDVPGPGWSVGVQGVSGWVVL